MLNKGQHQKNQ